MGKELRIAGDRELRVTVDTPGAEACVVACPPHPQMGGSRTDSKLRAVGETLGDADIACLRFDYGPWDDGEGEQRDVRNALAHARNDYESVGLFGYSFGAGVSLLAAADSDPQPGALSVLAPPASVGSTETVPALDAIECPVQIVYGERDTTVDWEPVVDRARELGAAVESVPGDHFFVGQTEKVATRVDEFLTAQIRS
jgi:alpha/beta superfamily hydrolase